MSESDNDNKLPYTEDDIQEWIALFQSTEWQLEPGWTYRDHAIHYLDGMANGLAAILREKRAELFDDE